MSLRKCDWRLDLPATMEAIEQCCAEFRLWHAGTCADLNPFPAELLLREALTNSVVHGCLEDPRRRVSCLIRAKQGRLVIKILDAGEGFDWRATRDRRADISDTRGRGIEILRRYASAVRFNSKGNSVTLVKRFLKENTIYER
jgi:anti-sigma regulatory factor (Ser/Thr protein kinase)